MWQVICTYRQELRHVASDMYIRTYRQEVRHAASDMCIQTGGKTCGK